MTTTEIATTEPDTAPPPYSLILIGSFAIYEMPDGGFTLAWKRKGEDISRQLPIPAGLLAMVGAQTGKSRSEILAELVGAPA